MMRIHIFKISRTIFVFSMTPLIKLKFYDHTFLNVSFSVSFRHLFMFSPCWILWNTKTLCECPRSVHFFTTSNWMIFWIDLKMVNQWLVLFLKQFRKTFEHQTLFFCSNWHSQHNFLSQTTLFCLVGKSFHQSCLCFSFTNTSLFWGSIFLISNHQIDQLSHVFLKRKQQEQRKFVWLCSCAELLQTLFFQAQCCSLLHKQLFQICNWKLEAISFCCDQF